MLRDDKAEAIQEWGTGTVRPEQGILRLRKELDTYGNLRLL